MGLYWFSNNKPARLCIKLNLFSFLYSKEVDAAEFIIKKRQRKGEIQYLVKWKDYPSSDNTWEPEKNILDKRLIQAYENKQIEKSSNDGNKEELPQYEKKRLENIEDRHNKFSDFLNTPLRKRFIPRSNVKN